MAEREFAATPYGVAYDCEMCGSEMSPTPNAPMLMSRPPQFPHRCENGHEANLPECYPLIRWRYAEKKAPDQ